MLEQSRILAAGCNLLLSKEAERIISSLDEEKIPVLVIKGLALAESVYPDISRRNMADIDLLVRERDLGTSVKTITELGYNLKLGNSGLLLVNRGNPPVSVDLRSGIHYLKEDEIFETARKARIGNFKTLSVEQTIIYTCYHMAILHGYPDRRWLEDLHRVITVYHDEIKWNDLIKKIINYKLTIPCYFCLIKAKELFSTSLPEEVLLRLKPKNSIKTIILKSFFRGGRPSNLAGYLLGVMFYPKQTLISAIFPPVDFMKMRYNVNPPLVYLFYILRPIFILIDCIKSLI